MRQRGFTIAILLLLSVVFLAVSVVNAQDNTFTDTYNRASAAFHRGLASSDSAEQKAAFEEALQGYDEAVSANPNDTSALLNRGAMYYELGDYDAAAADASRVLQLDPNSLFALQNRAAAYRAMGEVAAAYADYKQAYEFCLVAGCAKVSPHRFQTIEDGMKEMEMKLGQLNEGEEGGVPPSPTLSLEEVRIEAPDGWIWSEWQMRLQAHNVDRNGQTHPNQPGWACGLWNPGATNIENIAWHLLPASSSTHSREVWGQINGVWGQRAWTHFYAASQGWNVPPSGENYVVLVPETNVCLGNVGQVLTRGFRWVN